MRMRSASWLSKGWWVGGALAVALLVWFLVWKGSKVQDALTAAATICATVVAVAAAGRSVRSANSSREAERHARLALAMHNRPTVNISLMREKGSDAGEWTFYLTNPSGTGISNIQMTWTADGLRRERDIPTLSYGHLVDQIAFVPATLSAGELFRHIGSVRLEWEDRDGLVRWARTYQLKDEPPSGPGRFDPDGIDVSDWGLVVQPILWPGPMDPVW